MLKLNYYQTTRGIIVKKFVSDFATPLYFINDGVATSGSIGSTDWVFYDGVTDIHRVYAKANRNIVTGYELKFPELANDNAPMTISGDFPENLQGIRNLYREVAHTEEIDEDKEFIANKLHDGIIKHPEDPSVYVVSMTDSSNSFSPKTTSAPLTKFVTYDEFTTAVLPEFAWQYQPCKVSSDTAYSIIRAYVKNNINGKYASITSDYDFCFTVKKRISIKPHNVRYEQRTPKGNRYRPPRFKTRTVEHKELEIFEMTPLSRKYQGYTPIEGFSGDNLEDLKTNIDTYLEELIRVINEPWSECECCSGFGVKVPEKFEKNKREG